MRSFVQEGVDQPRRVGLSGGHGAPAASMVGGRGRGSVEEVVVLSEEENSLSFVTLNIPLNLSLGLLDLINNLRDPNFLNVLCPYPHKMSLTEIVQKRGQGRM